jgi:hypothetical protein
VASSGKSEAIERQATETQGRGAVWCTHSQSGHYIELRSQLHDLAALHPGTANRMQSMRK